MKRKDKEQLVGALADKLKGANAVFLTNYKGLTFPQMETIRKDIKSQGSDFRVVKNTLLKIALKENDITSLDDQLAEPTAVAIVVGDVAGVAKAIKKYTKDFKHLEIKGGVMEGTPVSANDIIVLADLPSREELLAKMLASFNAPVSNFVSLMANIPRSMLNVLTAIKDQKENS